MIHHANVGYRFDKFVENVTGNQHGNFLHTTTEASELVADVMWEHTPHGVAVSDVADVIALQRDSTVFWDYIDDEVTAP